MPRSALAGPVPAASKSIDYFDTLQDLAEYSATRLRQNRQPPPHPIRHEQGEIKDKRGRLLVCHDYKVCPGYFRSIPDELNVASREDTVSETTSEVIPFNSGIFAIPTSSEYDS